MIIMWLFCLVANLCPYFLRSLGYSPPGSSVPGIFQARILEWVVIAFSRRSSHPGIEPTSIALHVDSFLLSHLGNPHLKWSETKSSLASRWSKGCQSCWSPPPTEAFPSRWAQGGCLGIPRPWGASTRASPASWWAWAYSWWFPMNVCWMNERVPRGFPPPRPHQDLSV